MKWLFIDSREEKKKEEEMFLWEKLLSYFVLYVA